MNATALTTELGVPYVFTIDQMVDWAVHRGEYVTMADLDTMVSRVGRNHAPALMVDLWKDGLLDEDAYRLAGSVWCGAEHPQELLDDALWGWLFESAGYCVDGKPARRPRKALRLFRGATEDARWGWSWTDDREVAETFAHRQLRGRPLGQVWTALVEPSRLLARVTYRDESEYVVDTRPNELAPLVISASD